MQSKYSRSKLVEYIVNSMQSGANADKLGRQVAAYLMTINKGSELNSIMRDAQERRAEKYGIVELTATSTHPLEASHLKQIENVAGRQYASPKQVITHQVHDESALGGTSLLFPHSNLDITVRSKLNQLREGIS
jgi:F0F1-type ATP synthase delta subunit